MQLSLETFLPVGTRGALRRQDFDGDGAIQARIAGFGTCPMPPAPMGWRVS
jgi:hypothetical protein